MLLLQITPGTTDSNGPLAKHDGGQGREATFVRRGSLKRRCSELELPWLTQPSSSAGMCSSTRPQLTAVNAIARLSESLLVPTLQARYPQLRYLAFKVGLT